MITRLSSIIRWVAPAVLALFSPALLALGLGNATVESYLNQPLDVEIELITRPGESLEGVRAGLASAEDFALIGANRGAISVPLRFDIRGEADNPHIRVTSSHPVSDPIVRIIVEVTWPGGRMLREYTLFLDPPTVESAAPIPAASPRPGASSQPTRSQPAAQDGARDERPTDAAPPQTARPSAAQVPEEGEYGPVQSGETLWRIATDWASGTGLNVNQVMLAIQRNNPQAFINDNINLLKRGAILRMPRREDLDVLSPEAARIEVLEQESELSGGPVAPTSTAAVDTPLVEDESGAPEIAEPSPPEAPDAQLEIVPPAESEGVDSAYGTSDESEGVDTAASTAVLREELSRTEEELISERQENEFLRDRIAELEERLAAAPETGGTVTDPELAAMESRLREERETAAAPPASPQPAGTVPQVQSAPAEPDDPWYANWVAWLLVVLVVGLAAAGWYMSRRRAEEAEVSEPGSGAEDPVRGIADEAEEILKVLGPGAAGAAAGAEEDEVGAPEAEPAAVNQRDDDEEAELLDEDSEDPEVRLDLARAYISMGDREAARVILAEVIEHGDESQQAEARVMLEEL